MKLHLELFWTCLERVQTISVITMRFDHIVYNQRPNAPIRKMLLMSASHDTQWLLVHDYSRLVYFQLPNVWSQIW